MADTAQDRTSIQNHAVELLKRMAQSSSGDLDVLLKEQFPDTASTYGRPGDLNLGLAVHVKGRNADVIISKRAGRCAVRFVFDDVAPTAVPCDSFQPVSPATVWIFNGGKHVGEFDTGNDLESAFLCALLQAAGVGLLHV